MKKNWAFRSFDGEGITKDDVHIYTLLACSDTTSIENYDGLSSTACIRYLLSKIDDYYINIAYYFDYDITMILQDLEPDQLDSLRDIGYVYIQFGENILQIKHIPKKLFILALGKFVDNRFKSTKVFKLYDVSSFFQTSFVRALNNWNIQDASVDNIRKMKTQRSSFSKDDKEGTRMYCLSECNNLVKLCNKLRTNLTKIDILPKNWYGPGAIADTVLTRHKIRDKVLMDNSDISKTAYFGGRMSLSKIGICTQKIYAYDINSAYPSALANMPLMQGNLVESPEYSEYGLSEIFWETEDGYLPAFPWRDDKACIWYKSHGHGIYHNIEISAAMAQPHNKIKFVRHFNPEYVDYSIHPFEFIRDMYTYRQKLKQEGDLANIAIKLALNSLYGKFAQKTIRKVPKFQSYYVAGYCTAYTRAHILKAVGNSTETVHIATDGIGSLTPLNVEIGPELGQWSLEEYSGIEIYQPGFYRYPDLLGNNPLERTRGVSAESVDYDEAKRIFLDEGLSGKLVCPGTTFVKYTSGRKSTGSWVEQNKTIEFYPTRSYPESDDLPKNIIRLNPYPGSAELSHIYESS